MVHLGAESLQLDGIHVLDFSGVPILWDLQPHFQVMINFVRWCGSIPNFCFL